MEFNSNEEYLKAFPLKGPTFRPQRFADSDLNDCESLPQIAMQVTKVMNLTHVKLICIIVNQVHKSTCNDVLN